MTPDQKRALLRELLAKESRSVVREYPLSHGQRSLWFMHRLAPDSPVYNVAIAWRSRSSLDVPALHRAYQQLVDRHSILRTTYAVRDGGPVQRVSTSAEVAFVQIDATAMADSELHDQVVEHARQPFDLQSGPVLRVHLFTRATNESVQLVTLHHIACDLWTVEQLMEELRVIYVAEVSGESSALAKLECEYADFVKWQASMLDGPVGEAHWDYWKRTLAGNLPVLDLPLDRPRPRVQTYAGAAVAFDIDLALARATREFASRARTTPYVTFLSAFFVLLHRYTRHREIMVGAPTLGRTRPEFEGLVGYFVNPVVFRANLADDPSFIELVGQMRRTVIDALDHQDFPFPLLVERLQVARDPSRSPLIDVFFVWDRTRLDKNQVTVDAGDGGKRIALDWGEVELESFTLRQVGAPSDLLFFVVEHGDGLSASFIYNTDLFDAATIERLAKHFQTILRDALEHPDTAVSRLTVLDERERAVVLGLSALRTPAPSQRGTLHRKFEQRVNRDPDRVAVRFEGAVLTYRDLNTRANRVARRLRARGARAGALIGLSVERSFDVVVGILAILKTGAGYVPLDPAYPLQRRRFMLENSGAAALLATSAVARDSSEHAVVLIDDESLVGESTENLDVDGCADDIAYVIYTSGSTGRPKGVMVTHGNVLRLFESTSHWFAFDESDIWSLFHSYSFDFSVWELWGALLHGGSVLIVPHQVSRSPDDFYQLLRSAGVTVLSQTPSAFRQLSWAEEKIGVAPDLALRWIVFGGEALDLPSLKSWFERHGDERPRLVNMYGITETTVHVTFREIRSEDSQPGTASLIGSAIPDLSLYVLDEHGQLLPIGVPGELYVGGAGVAKGYLNLPALTAERFVANPFDSAAGCERLYRTGDLVRRRSDGDIEYLGRIDNQIQIRGFRVELGEIESVLASQPGVKQALVVARGSQADIRLIAYVVPTHASLPDVALLRAYAQKELPDYMMPAVIVMIDSVPLTPNGKVDFAALPEPPSQRASIGGDFVPPRTAVERKVAEIWSELLGIDQVGASDNFFDLGGHSLLGTRVASRLADAFGVELPLRTFFESPTVEAIAERIEALLLVTPDSVATEGNAPRDEFVL
jgi:amino acid adenylation domain-containing protein